MDETFYTALGIDADADTDAIKRAYRDRIKETHPDVSDDPSAAEEFKRLTTARDVLVDSTERKRYDRLGHNEYVHEHVSDSTWNSETVTTATDTADKTSAGKQSTTTTEDTKSWYTNIHDHTDDKRSTASGTNGSRSRSHSRADGGYGNAGWQTASETYRRTDMNVENEDPSSVETALNVANSLGSWLFVHLTLIVSAVATGWFFYSTKLHAEVSLAALVGATLLIMLVLALSTLHILLEVYS
jgi:curved DNA-binding protein CbpA